MLVSGGGGGQFVYRTGYVDCSRLIVGHGRVGAGHPRLIVCGLLL